MCAASLERRLSLGAARSEACITGEMMTLTLLRCAAWRALRDSALGDRLTPYVLWHNSLAQILQAPPA